jgi:anaerobic dimethyl sulfoxide reductase subunit B
MIACKEKNDLGPGIRWRRVYEYTGGEWLPLPDGTFRQDVFAYYVSVSCNHCPKPICVEVCPTGAMKQDGNGIVTVNETRCTGCRNCEDVCPYGAPQYNAGKGIMTKCDFCQNELEAGGVPACVAACPTRALSFGELAELKDDRKGNRASTALPHDELTGPAAFFRLPDRMKPANSAAGQIMNREEIEDIS